MKDTWFAVGRRWWAHEGVDATGVPWALPFILDAIKDGNGRCTDLALTDARILRAARLDQLIKADGHSIRDAYVAVGILVADDDGWGARNWDKWQRDDVKAKKQKADRERIAEKRGQSRAVSQNVAATNCDAGDGRRESPRVAPHTDTHTGTSTEQALVVLTTSRAPVPAREDKAPAVPPPTTNTSPAPGTPEGKLQGHPARDALLPMAHAALDIVGAVPEIATLENWYAQKWTLDRVKFGLSAAKQDHAGQTIPVGKLIMSAARWMARARPDEYTPPRPALTLVQPAAIEKPREATPEERAEMVRRFEELDALLADPKPMAKAQ